MPIQKYASPFLAILLISIPSGYAQSSAGAGAGNVSAMLQPTLSDVQRTVGSLNTGKWKAPGEVRAAADRNLSSIQRDLVETLPGLISQADAAAGTVAPAFAVYRNIDALYDVLLRVNQTAMLAAPDNDASAVSGALQEVEAARRQLGDAIVASAQDREAQIEKLQAAVKAAAAAPPPAPPKTAVVDDGPAQATVKKKKRKPAAKPAEPSATSSGSAPAPSTAN